MPTAQLTGTLLSGQLSGSYGGAVSFNNAASTFNGAFTGYIRSLDTGGFNGGLGFFGNGAGNKFGDVEVMRVINGNVGIGPTNPTNRVHVAGGVSATAFVSTSDRNSKENFTPISPAEVLAKVAALPIMQWNFKLSIN